MSLLVKICGLSTRETLGAALDAGADMVGFVFFPPSPRHLGLEPARALGQQVRRRAVKVALTVDADDATLTGIVEALQPDILQLHGHETPARVTRRDPADIGADPRVPRGARREAVFFAIAPAFVFRLLGHVHQR